MSLEDWLDDAILALVRTEATDCFSKLLQPDRITADTRYVHSAIREIREIDPRSLNLIRWPDRAWSVIAEIWKGTQEHKENRGSAGITIGAWYDNSHLVELIAFEFLTGAFDASLEDLHQELLEKLPTRSIRSKLMSHAARVRLSKAVGAGGQVQQLTDEEIQEIKRKGGKE